MSQDQHIFVVDDEQSAREMVGDYLRMHGFAVTLCDGGGSLRKALESQTADLIVLDLNMPMMNGWDILEFLQKEYYKEQIPVAIFTSSIDLRDASRSKHYRNVIGHFVKPITRNLLEKIKDSLETHQAQNR